MAAKKYYFGVGGGTRQFLSIIEKDGKHGLFDDIYIYIESKGLCFSSSAMIAFPCTKTKTTSI